MNQHYVPKFHIKKWSNKSGQVLYYTIKYNKVISSYLPPSGICCSDDLYTKKDVSETIKQSLETKVYSPIDNKAA